VTFEVTSGYVDIECDTDEGAFGASTKLNDSNGWIVDSGLSSHMTPVREILVNYVEFAKPRMVCLVDGRMVEALGRNIHLTMVLTLGSSKRVTMYDALYIPNLKLICSLLRQLQQKVML